MKPLAKLCLSIDNTFVPGGSTILSRGQNSFWVFALIIAANDPNGAILLMQTSNHILFYFCNGRYFTVQKTKNGDRGTIVFTVALKVCFYFWAKGCRNHRSWLAGSQFLILPRGAMRDQYTVLYFRGLVIIWRIVSKWRRPWRLREAFVKPSRGLREAFAERVFEKASRSLQGATTNPSRRFTNPSRRLHIPKVPRRRLGGFTRPPRRVRGWTACSYSIMTVTVFGQYYTVFRTVDSSTVLCVW